MTVPVQDLPTLATPDDIVARMGRNLNQTEAARVDAMLKDGSGIIRNIAGQDFMAITQDTMVIIGDAGRIIIPQKPVISVDGLVAVSGFPGIPDLTITWFSFDGIDEILVPDTYYSGIINLPWYWYNTIWSRQSFRLTFTHGWSSTPGEVVALLCGSIISELSTPTMSATLQSEAIGAYSYSMRRREVGGGIYAALLDFGMKDILARYRRNYGTISTRF